MMSQARPSAGMRRTSPLPSKALITESVGINGHVDVFMCLHIGVTQNKRLQEPGGWSLHSTLSYRKKVGVSQRKWPQQRGLGCPKEWIAMQWRGEAWSWSREAARPCCSVSRVVLSNHGTGEQGVMHTCSLSNWEAKAALLIIQDFKLDYMAHLRPAWNTYTRSYLKKRQQ